MPVYPAPHAARLKVLYETNTVGFPILQGPAIRPLEYDDAAVEEFGTQSPPWVASDGVLHVLKPNGEMRARTTSFTGLKERKNPAGFVKLYGARGAYCHVFNTKAVACTFFGIKAGYEDHLIIYKDQNTQNSAASNLLIVTRVQMRDAFVQWLNDNDQEFWHFPYDEPEANIDDYYIGRSDGLVLTCTSMVEMLPVTEATGYKHVNLTNKTTKKPVKRFVNRIIYGAFVPDFDRAKEIDHIDSDPTNNCIDNLQSLSSYENLTKPRAPGAPRHLIVDQRSREPPLHPLDMEESSWFNIGVLGTDDFGASELSITGNQRHVDTKRFVKRHLDRLGNYFVTSLMTRAGLVKVIPIHRMMGMRFFLPIYKAASSSDDSEPSSVGTASPSSIYMDVTNSAPPSPMALDMDTPCETGPVTPMPASTIDDLIPLAAGDDLPGTSSPSSHSMTSIRANRDITSYFGPLQSNDSFITSEAESSSKAALTATSADSRSCSPICEPVETTYERFLRLTEQGMVIDHLDSCKTNNAIWNLEFKTTRENTVAAMGSRFEVVDLDDLAQSSTYDSYGDMIRALGGRQTRLAASESLKVVKDVTWNNVKRNAIVVLRLDKNHDRLYKEDISNLAPANTRQFKIWDPNDKNQPPQLVFGAPKAAVALGIQPGTLKKHMPKNLNETVTLKYPKVRVQLTWKNKSRSKICIQRTM
ncbi:hypothetical protein BC940DRAFT_320827 [Gongronella butleri]|nr:hypothetical protein BC940DRAFT_320827 [Gongronella butleri]